MEGETLHWMEVTLLVPESDPLELEALEAHILAVTPGGFAVEAWDAPPLPGEREPVPMGWMRYLVYVGEHVLEGARLALENALASWPGATLSVAPLDPGWRERWKQYFKPLHASTRFVVAPPWEEAQAPDQGFVLIIEPAMAFGTAQHETTALCLERVDTLYAEHHFDTMLDVGTGTGILAIAASLLGARRALGVDNDANAVLAARDNLRLNPEVATHDIRMEGTPIAEVEGTFDLVAANILTPTLMLLKNDIAKRVGSKGHLMLSGILSEQAPEVISGYEAEGLTFLGRGDKNGWVRLDFIRAAAATD